MTLSLRANARCATDFATWLDRHARALVRSDAGAFDVTHHANADVASLGAQPRLFVANELFVADDLSRLVQRRQIIAAVVDERRRILEHDFVVHRKLVRPDQIAPANLHAIDPKLSRGEIEKPL